MRRIREALRRHLQAGLTYSSVAFALKISMGVVGKYMPRARAVSVACATADVQSDEAPEARLFHNSHSACMACWTAQSGRDKCCVSVIHIGACRTIGEQLVMTILARSKSLSVSPGTSSRLG